MNSELRLVSVVAETGSISKSAKVLGISQPAVSMRLNKIEESRGIIIFNRDKNPIELTDEGVLYLEFLKKQEIVEADLMRKVTQLRDHKKSRVVVGGPSVYVDSIIVSVIRSFMDDFPDCRIEVINGEQSGLAEMALDGKLDFFVCMSGTMSEDFITENIGNERLVLALPKGILKTDNSIEKPARLKDYSVLNNMSFIKLDESKPLQKMVDGFLSEIKATVACRTRVDQVITGIKLASKSEACFVASTDAIKAAGEDDSFDFACLPQEYAIRPIFIAYNKFHELGECQRQFIELMREYLGNN